MFKIILIGSASVGKSSMTSRFCDFAFDPDMTPTLGMDFKYFQCGVQHRYGLVRLQLWDTSGQDTFATLTSAYYRNCQGALLCFDLTDRDSFKDLENWYSLLCRHACPLPPVILVGCKRDLTKPDVDKHGFGLQSGSLRQVQESEAAAWAREHNCISYFETSAKENINVSEAFEQLVTHICESNSFSTTVRGNRDEEGKANRTAFQGISLRQGESHSEGNNSVSRGGCCGGKDS